MTDESSPPTPDPVDPSGAIESLGSARDGELADSLGIEDAARRHDAAADGLPTAESPAPRPPREPPRPPADLSRLEAAHRGEEAEQPPADVAGAPISDSTPLTGSGRSGRRAAKKGQRRRPRRKAPWWELPVLVVVAIGIAVLVKTFVVQPFYIPSASMENTLYGATSGGDRILVNKPIYDLRAPHPGDIVVFNAPPGWNDGPGTTPPSNPVLRVVRGFGQLVGFVPPDGLVLVKRVIATGGQSVKGVSTDGGKTEQIMISDHGTAGPWRTLNEPYVYLPGPDGAANFGPVTVPKSRLWVMGDHRNDSADSRYHCTPDAEDPAADGPTCDATSATVPISDVIGKAVVIAWPPSRWRTLGTPSTFAHDAAALGGEVPPVASLLLVAPVYLARRRRRR
jgi:signal peptidase I